MCLVEPPGNGLLQGLIKDAQRHGLRVQPVDVACSDSNCTVEKEREQRVLRVGLRYVRGLHKAAAEQVVTSRASSCSLRFPI
ncbi:MAG: hypothetical protein ACJ74Z_13930 [Bryobacteraceae bacterium]